jgi:hypothetical protein
MPAIYISSIWHFSYRLINCIPSRYIRARDSTVCTTRGTEKLVGPLPEIIDLNWLWSSVFGIFTDAIIQKSYKNGYVVLGFLPMWTCLSRISANRTDLFRCSVAFSTGIYSVHRTCTRAQKIRFWPEKLCQEKQHGSNIDVEAKC